MNLLQSIRKCVIAMTIINVLRFQSHPHVPYSPDLAPSDNFHFSNLKKNFGGKIFANNEVEPAIDRYLEELTIEHHNFPHSMFNCITTCSIWIHNLKFHPP